MANLPPFTNFANSEIQTFIIDSVVSSQHKHTYTVVHKKGATFTFTITLTNVGRF